MKATRGPRSAKGPGSGAHLFVDESKSKVYYLAATAVLPEDVTAVRKQLVAVRLPRQERLHLTHEGNDRRQRVLAAMSRLEAEVRLYKASTRNHVEGRRANLAALLDDAQTFADGRIDIERDDSVAAADRRLISEHLRVRQFQTEYQHHSAKEEPILWISDAVAWCFQRGGPWPDLCQAIVIETREV